MNVKKAIIPAAGLGTRFLPATKAQPKEMLPIVDKPTIQYIVEEAIAAGIEDILIVTGKDKGSIEDHFDKSIELELALKEKGQDEMLDLVQDISNLVDIHYIRQKQPLGLGHAIYCARTFINDEPFAVLLGDDVVVSREPAIGQMMEIMEDNIEPVLGVQPVPPAEVNKYGIVDYIKKEGRVYQVKDMIEKPSREQAPSHLAILGRYIITPDIFPILENTEPGRGGEIQLTDALRTLSQKRNMKAYNFKGKRYDIGNKMGFLKATVEFALRREDLREEFREYLKELVQNELDQDRISLEL